VVATRHACEALVLLGAALRVSEVCSAGVHASSELHAHPEAQLDDPGVDGEASDGVLQVIGVCAPNERQPSAGVASLSALCGAAL